MITTQYVFMPVKSAVILLTTIKRRRGQNHPQCAPSPPSTGLGLYRNHCQGQPTRQAPLPASYREGGWERRLQAARPLWCSASLQPTGTGTVTAALSPPAPSLPPPAEKKALGESYLIENINLFNFL